MLKEIIFRLRCEVYRLWKKVLFKFKMYDKILFVDKQLNDFKYNYHRSNIINR